MYFDGEYSNDERWNGKWYNKDKNDEKDAISKFLKNPEFELINGCGKIKEYYYYGRLKFEGGYVGGKRNGKEKNNIIMEN